MNTYITLACLLAVAGVSHGSAIGWDGLGIGGVGIGGLGIGGLGIGGLGIGGLGLGHTVISSPIVVPAAVSTANQWKAAPIPVIKTISAPIITSPVIKTVAVSPLGLGGLGGLGLGSLGSLGPIGLKSGLGWH